LFIQITTKISELISRNIHLVKSFQKIFLTTAVILLSGCQTFLDVSDNLLRNFSKPEQARFYVNDPVKDSVSLSVLWIGHASALIQIYDKVIMIDPLLTNNVAAVLRRHYIPAINLEALKKCDIILISHSHMDHLSPGSLDILEEKFPSANLVFPEGAEDYIPGYSFKLSKLKMADLSNKYIGDSVSIDGVKIFSIKSVHWGGRYGIDGKLWTDKGHCAYIIEYKDMCIYYSGDSSYDESLFKFIGRNFKIDLALVNIIFCDSCTELNQSKSHLYPMGAVQILKDTGAEYMIPLHFGTFTNVNAQIKVLKKMMHKDDEMKGKIKILNLGEQIILKTN